MENTKIPNPVFITNAVEPCKCEHGNRSCPFCVAKNYEIGKSHIDLLNSAKEIMKQISEHKETAPISVGAYLSLGSAISRAEAIK